MKERFLWKCLHIDKGEDDIVQDVDSVNLVELSDAVPELKQRDVVHCHPERLVTAQDLHLEQSGNTTDVLLPSRVRIGLRAVHIEKDRNNNDNHDFFMEESLF